MNEELDKIMFSYMPNHVKLAAATYNTHKLVEQATGLTDLTFDKVAAYLATKMAERQARWQGVGDGLLALHALQKGAAEAPQPLVLDKKKKEAPPAPKPFSESFPGYSPPPIKF